MTDKPTTREQIKTMLDNGLNVRQIAAFLGISTQAVYKHIKKLDRVGAAK